MLALLRRPSRTSIPVPVTPCLPLVFISSRTPSGVPPLPLRPSLALLLPVSPLPCTSFLRPCWPQPRALPAQGPALQVGWCRPSRPLSAEAVPPGSVRQGEDVRLVQSILLTATGCGLQRGTVLPYAFVQRLVNLASTKACSCSCNSLFTICRQDESWSRVLGPSPALSFLPAEEPFCQYTSSSPLQKVSRSCPAAAGTSSFPLAPRWLCSALLAPRA